MPGEDSLRDAVIQDFNRIAASAQPTWNHNIHYYPLLLRQLPAQLTRVLDVGCGNGDLVRRIAARASRVEGLDFSPGMITTARALTPPTQYPQVHYECADVMDTALDAGSYDAIVSVATVHHLPFEACLAKFHTALKPGGVLVLLDLYQPKTTGEMLLSLAAVPVNRCTSGIAAVCVRMPRKRHSGPPMGNMTGMHRSARSPLTHERSFRRPISSDCSCGATSWSRARTLNSSIVYSDLHCA